MGFKPIVYVKKYLYWGNNTVNLKIIKYSDSKNDTDLMA